MFLTMSVPLAVVETSSARLSPNRAFASLLCIDGAEGSDLYLSSLVPAEQWPDVERVLAGVTSGLIESCQGRAQLQLPAGGGVDVVGWIRPLDDSRPCERALLAVVPADGTQPPPEPWLASVDTKRVAFGALDHEWRFREMSHDVAEVLGWKPRDYMGSPLHGAVHPDDVPLLLLTLGRSGSEHRAAATRIRVRGSEGEWMPVQLVVSPLCDHNPPRFAVALWGLLSGDDGESAEDRVARLEGHLWRIAAEVQAAGINDLPRFGRVWWADPVLRSLTRRQMEVLRRLAGGQRISDIARELFVSQSTVRNHLSAIYRQVGVHSQSELLARLMQPSVESSE
jgi:PAS domain S-box-containing protein